MDLVAACRVFVLVGERGSVTLGAAAARVPQPVASRRIAALERHLGGRLFDRSARRVALTEFGRDLLPPAKRLVRLADALTEHAEQARLRPLTVAVPAAGSVRSWALLEAAAREHGTVLELRAGAPAERRDLLRFGDVRAALAAVPPSGATWTVPLGVAAARAGAARPLRLEELRPGRSRGTPRRLWIQPEDDVPHVRDELARAGHRAALAPAQVAVAVSLTTALSNVLAAGDLVLCPAAQAAELDLAWRPLAGPAVARGYAVSPAGGEAEVLGERLRSEVGRCLGVPEERA